MPPHALAPARPARPLGLALPGLLAFGLAWSLALVILPTDIDGRPRLVDDHGCRRCDKLPPRREAARTYHYVAFVRWVARVILMALGAGGVFLNKLCTLLGRAELRDLVDVSAILAAGGDLDRAVSEAPRKDGGFSALTLAWLLSKYPAMRLANAYGIDPEHAEQLRASLEARLVELARREADPGDTE